MVNDGVPCYLGVDIGGTWIKAACRFEKKNQAEYTNASLKSLPDFPFVKIRNELTYDSPETEIIRLIEKIVGKLQLDKHKIEGIGISTAGIVNYKGTEVLEVSSKLAALKKSGWRHNLEHLFDCKVVLINDAEAALIGLTQLGKVNGYSTVGIMPIGTGIGFCIWRNGRRWRPGKNYPLIGEINTPMGSYDEIVSASGLAKYSEDNDLTRVLKDTRFRKVRNRYLKNLIKVINSISVIYNLDKIIVCGGLADASHSCDFPLEQELKSLRTEDPIGKRADLKVAFEGNKLQLIGASTLAENTSKVANILGKVEYTDLVTEAPYNNKLRLEELDSFGLAEIFWKAEKEAHIQLKDALPMVAKIVDESIDRLNLGGRIIYIGSGTSGRIAAMDAVEIPCTYGFPEDRILTLISGGLADASFEIESDFEEDASSIPEMLLLSLGPNDIVIGISASGSAQYVRTGLGFAKCHGALTIMIQVGPENIDSIYDYILPLNSGCEVVAGSTRMKAGTATKKILNLISSSIMIRLGKVKGSYMIDLACYNNKLVDRAKTILGILYGIDQNEAMSRLREADMQLNKAIDILDSSR